MWEPQSKRQQHQQLQACFQRETAKIDRVEIETR
jgi:hypothetical protein